MDARKKVSDRRFGERSGNPRRRDVRLYRSFGISLLNYNGKVVDVSASGVYFEVITNDVKAFSQGTTIPLQINAYTHSYEGREVKFIISGRGKVVRNCIIMDLDHSNSLGVALEFTEKLHTGFDKD